MEQREIAVLMKAIAPVIREAIVNAVKPVADRLIALEGREPEAGEKGEAGRDGFSLSDFDINPCEDGRSIVLSFTQGEVRNEFELTFPVPIYRGTFKAGEEYVPGDSVTWGGSLWIAERKTTDKPDTAESGWKLAVKKGRDGKDARG